MANRTRRFLNAVLPFLALSTPEPSEPLWSIPRRVELSRDIVIRVGDELVRKAEAKRARKAKAWRAQLAAQPATHQRREVDRSEHFEGRFWRSVLAA